MDNGNKLKWIIGTHGNWKKNQKFWGPFWSTANSADSPQKWAKCWIGIAVQLVAPKRPPQFWFFQLSCVPIIHLSLYLLSIECLNLSCIINQSYAGVKQTTQSLIAVLTGEKKLSEKMASSSLQNNHGCMRSDNNSDGQVCSRQNVVT